LCGLNPAPSVIFDTVDTFIASAARALYHAVAMMDTFT
jgi:hypothetical protein